jgi:nucleotide-binding universal stress UspA family protein
MGDEFQREIQQRAQADVDKLKLRAGIDAAVTIKPGNPAEVIADVAKQDDADLLVVGRHDGEGITASLFQHAYAILSQSPCPVITV